MGKVKKEGRLFYRKTSKPKDASAVAALPLTESISAFKSTDIKPATATTETINQPQKQSKTKKSTLRQRKENLIQKISVKQSAAKRRNQQKKKTKKQKQQVERVKALTNLNSLKNALPSLNDNLPSLNSLFMLKTCAELKTGVPKFDKKLVVSQVSDEEPKKPTKAMKTRHKKKVFMKRYDYLQKLMSDKEFKKDPPILSFNKTNCDPIQGL
ncbi:hypothetical protein Bhyg_15882 [Pseudolycoriella hygida]|uniref:Ribosome biogenesis protein SLX9 n=1 Tax=Pseudolycoriella hygida TaxID=35572 RepID=A0A9Q0MLY4_9DIPT|nr:hypothetical protein Bhyg_15882 [Pseudolycoriella hygida]